MSRRCVVLACALVPMACALAAPMDRVFPGAAWESRTPEEVGLDRAKLDAIAEYAGGRGCVIRHGYYVYGWGDVARRGDVASALKPWITHFLFVAVEEGLLPSTEALVADFEPRLKDLNEALGHKDRAMQFRHLAFQTACYGLENPPGTAFAYNDWQMALFFDTLFTKVYGKPLERADPELLHPKLTDIIGCEDAPTFLAFGTGDRPGRLAVSPRDFARFGWLYLNEGNWNGRQLILRAHAKQAVTQPLPGVFPRSEAGAADMIEGQRSIGSRRIPDNQCDHGGSYSWLWWVNGVNREGKRRWPDAPTDTFAALGHGDMRGMAVLPSLDLVISWNDTKIGEKPLNEVFRLLMGGAADAPALDQVMPDPENAAWLVRNSDANGDGRLDPFLMCGPGDPEGFLYRGTRNADGTRNGDQEAIIDKMAGTGANCIYLEAIRSHGGDGDATHNPFVDSDPAKGLDQNILQQWEAWFRLMDEHGIVVYFFVYDDSARLWDTGDAVGDEEQAFLTELANRFEHHRNWMWCVAEEYEEAFSPARVRNIATVIRTADEYNHVIAVHKNGLVFDEFADCPDIDQFAIEYNEPEARALHDGMVTAWGLAKDRYNLNMSETADHGFGATARRKNWACAMGGAHIMALEWLFDTEDAPSRGDLEDCGRLVAFFEGTDFNTMAPHDELGGAGTEYVLAQPGQSYIAYSSAHEGKMGLKGMAKGAYTLTWLDIETGKSVEQKNVKVKAGDAAWGVPKGFGGEVAVWVRMKP